jgi:hypothetical protein
VRTRLIRFGEVEVEGRRYPHDVVIDGGRVRKRSKRPSKPLRDRYGHTPLTAAEKIPWTGPQLIVGTGASGALPIADDVRAEAARRHVELVILSTAEACRLLEDIDRRDARAILHVTC